MCQCLHFPDTFYRINGALYPASLSLPAHINLIKAVADSDAERRFNGHAGADRSCINLFALHADTLQGKCGTLSCFLLVQPQPVFAIGGIDLSNVARVTGTGAAGIAVISAIAEAADPGRAARALVEALRECGGA